MHNRLRSRLESGRQDGFTLIELLIVIVILGILAAIVVFAVGGITDRGSNAACRSDFKNVEVAQEAYYAKNKAYAADTTALVTAKLLREAPPTSGGEYQITTSSTGVVVAAGNESASSKCK